MEEQKKRPLTAVVAEVFKVPEILILGKNQDTEYCDARKAYYYFLREVACYPWWRMTNITGRKIRHMSYNSNQGKIRIETEYAFKKKMERIHDYYIQDLIEMP